MNEYDVVIVGAGAAGLSAALYTSRRRLKTLILSKDMGGQTATTMDIENYPGVDFSTGPDLMKNFAAQAKKFGAELVLDEVIGISRDGQKFSVSTKSGKTYSAKAIILGLGKRPRELDVAGEEKFRNKGVVYCATCDAPLFKDKIVAVIGGGNAAFDSALLLSKIAAKVYLIHRRNEFRAENILVERAKQTDKIEFILNAIVDSIEGKDFVDSVVISTPSGKKTLAVEGVFVEIGQIVPSSFIKGLVELNDAGEIIIDNVNQTSASGIFAAGDATIVPFKQMVVSAGEGAKAALAAYNYIQGQSLDTATADQGYIK
ncbi:thioredoxin-disulfide reductase [candidate division Kazan bacterium]|uniref:Thioredoxin-disulfide reductase n=1 Tax=candidate division Kazan bacterium TaxID=2202143 RepID=A0A420ZDI7_UNCK3|nr:MAG: thioredoxin-disulfide reductase [candidate division Kazan bacterium]